MNHRHCLEATCVGASFVAVPLAAGAQDAAAVETVTATSFVNGAIGKDEADAMRRLDRLLRRRLPNTTIVSVGHRSTLASFDEHRLDLVLATHEPAGESHERTFEAPDMARN